MSEASQIISLLKAGKIKDLTETYQRIGRLISSELSGGHTEDCSYVIFLLLNRVLGEDATGRSQSSHTISESWTKGVLGGWLRESCASPRQGPSSRRRSISEAPTVAGFSTKDLQVSSDAIHLLRLFSGANISSSVVNILDRLLPCDDVSLSIFPPKVRMKLLNRVEYECMASPNHFIYDEWYCGPGAVQGNFLMNSPGAIVGPTEEDVVLSMDMFAYFMMCFLRYPTVNNDNVFPTVSYRTESQTFDQFFSGGASGGSSGLGWFESSGGRVKHMLSVDPEIPLLAALRCEGKLGWIRGNPYLALLENYLESFLPLPGAAVMRTPGAGGDSFVSGGSDDELSAKGERFLRLAIDFWIDTAPVVRFSYDKVSYFKDILSQRSFRGGNSSRLGVFTSPGESSRVGASSSVSAKIDGLGPGGGSISSSKGNTAMDRYAFEALQDSYPDGFSRDHNQPTPGDQHPQVGGTGRIQESMEAIPIPTYDAWCTSTSATSAVPAGGMVPFAPRPSCTEVILLSTSLAPVPTKSTLQCIYLLVCHVLTGVSKNHFRQLGRGASSWYRGYGDDMGGAITALPLPPAVQMLQQPIFDMLRSLLARKEKLDRTTFHLVVRIWQAWLTPWDQQTLARRAADMSEARRAGSKNTMAAAAHTVSRAVSGGITLGDASRQFGEGYEEGWRPYVAANLHFYTTLHVLFLRALSRRDLSTNLTALLHILDNNLRIFTPKLISDIDMLSMSYLYRHSRDSRIDFSARVDESVRKSYLSSPEDCSAVEFDSIYLQHVNLFPDISMANEAEAIVHFRAEALEAVIFIADFLHRLGDVQHSIVGNLVNGVLTDIIYPLMRIQTRKSNRPSRVKEMSTLLLNMFFIKEAFGSSGDRRSGERGWESLSGGNIDHRDNERDVFNKGNLTPVGKRDLVSGERLCDKRAIQYQGDVMDKPLRSDEFGALAKLMVHWSKKLNAYYSLPQDPRSTSLTWTKILSLPSDIRFDTLKSSLRINLRFIAHLKFLCFLAFIIAYVACRFRMLDSFYFTLIVVVVSILYSRGTFFGVLPWQSY